MDEYNEKDHLVGEESGEPAPRELAPAEQAPVEPAPIEPDAQRENAPYYKGQESAPAGDCTQPGETAYWSSRGGDGGQGAPRSVPPAYQGAYQPQGRPPYPPPYYSQNNNRHPGYGYGQQPGVYPPAGGGRQQQQYGTSSGWQAPPPPPQQPDHYNWEFADYDHLPASDKPEKKRRNRGVVVFTVVLVGFLCVGLLGLSAYSVLMAAQGFEEAEGGVTASSPSESGSAVAEELPEGELEITARQDFSESLPVGGKMTIPQVAETVLPSVAGVFNYRNSQMVEPSELGSGIVMNTDGYIITNAHVVAGGTGFKVQIHGGDTYDAILVGYDEMSDLAVLKIEAEGLVPAQFGESEELRVGEAVVAIGNPAGLTLAGSVTQGIISAVDRLVQDNNMKYIQTDAAINPGNSGGALANEYGQVIGINSSKIVAEGYEGIGFAIPISEAKPIIDELISSGRVASRAMLGIKGVVVDAVGARTYGERGILIAEFLGGEDLLENGAQIGDIITHVDGVRIYTMADLRNILDTKQAGDSVTLTLYRRVVSQETNFDVETRLVANDGAEE